MDTFLEVLKFLVITMEKITDVSKEEEIYVLILNILQEVICQLHSYIDENPNILEGSLKRFENITTQAMDAVFNFLVQRRRTTSIPVLLKVSHCVMKISFEPQKGFCVERGCHSYVQTRFCFNYY